MDMVRVLSESAPSHQAQGQAAAASAGRPKTVVCEENIDLVHVHDMVLKELL